MKLEKKKYNLFNKIDVNEIKLGILSEIEGNDCNIGLMSIRVQLDSHKIIEFVGRFELDIQFYWKSRESKFETLCLGSVLNWTSKKAKFNSEVYESIQNTMKDSDLRIYGGIRFSEHCTISKKWSEYGYYYFFLPKFEIRKESETHLIYNFNFDRDISPEEFINEDFKLFEMNICDDNNIYNNNLSQIDNRKDDPDKSKWITNIHSAKEQINKGNLSKVVLSRESRFETSNFNCSEVLKKLYYQNSNAFIFMFKLGDSCLLGASPELFYSREWTSLQVDSLAGTRLRDNDPIEDLELENELLNSEKDLKEQQIVTDTIVDSLSSLSENIKYDKKVCVKKFAKVQHLYTEINTELKNGVTDKMIINALHPTPAMGGLPRTQALNLINDLEHHDRGFYSAPLGYMSENKTELSVCIRCGLLHKDNLYLYSGAGIVGNSNPKSEWDEINNKLANFLRIFEDNNG